MIFFNLVYSNKELINLIEDKKTAFSVKRDILNETEESKNIDISGYSKRDILLIFFSLPNLNIEDLDLLFSKLKTLSRIEIVYILNKIKFYKKMSFFKINFLVSKFLEYDFEENQNIFNSVILNQNIKKETKIFLINLFLDKNKDLKSSNYWKISFILKFLLDFQEEKIPKELTFKIFYFLVNKEEKEFKIKRVGNLQLLLNNKSISLKLFNKILLLLTKNQINKVIPWNHFFIEEKTRILSKKNNKELFIKSFFNIKTRYILIKKLNLTNLVELDIYLINKVAK